MQKKANVGACVPLRKKDEYRHAEFIIAQKALNREMMVKERLSCSQARQSVLDSTISPDKRTVTGEMKLLESETLDSSIASFFYENALVFQCFGVAGAVRRTRMSASAARSSRMRTNTASFVILPHGVACRIACRRSARMRTSAARAAPCAGTQHAIRHAHDARRRHAILDQSSGEAWAK